MHIASFKDEHVKLVVEQRCELFTFDSDDESGSLCDEVGCLCDVTMMLRYGGVLRQLSAMTERVAVSEIESYLAVMRLINVALALPTECAQGTRVAT